MSQVFSRRAQLDTSCDSDYDAFTSDPEALLLLRSHTINRKWDSLACQRILVELLSHYFTKLFVK